MNQSTEVKHTPTPWQLIDHGYDRPDIRGRGNEPIIESGYKPMAKDAALIVRAVNSHNEMLDALKIFTELGPEDCQWCKSESWYGDNHMSACPVATAERVIAKAEGKS